MESMRVKMPNSYIQTHEYSSKAIRFDCVQLFAAAVQQYSINKGKICKKRNKYDEKKMRKLKSREK